ncbi:hypothetical protein Micbo1qcDRAFT_165316, partial [Microdochium bolleyi]
MIRSRTAQIRRDAGVCALCQHRVLAQRSLSTAYRTISTTRTLRQSDSQGPPSSSTPIGPRTPGASSWGAPSALGPRGGSGWGASSFAKPATAPSDDLLSPHELEQRKRLLAQREEAQKPTQPKRPLPPFKHVFNAERQGAIYEGWQREAAENRKESSKLSGMERLTGQPTRPASWKATESPRFSGIAPGARARPAPSPAPAPVSPATAAKLDQPTTLSTPRPSSEPNGRFDAVRENPQPTEVKRKKSWGAPAMEQR